MILLNNIKQNKLINKGLFGLVYLGYGADNKQYAIKFSKVGKKCITKTYREFDFCEIMSAKYPNHFIKFYDYKFVIDDKTLDFSEFTNLLNVEDKKYYNDIINSNHLSIKLYSYIDMTLYDLISGWKTFNYTVFNNLLIQIIYVITLINADGYFHNDLHFKNIGLTKTNAPFIEILNNRIPTHGYYVTIIDNDNVLHNKYSLLDYETDEINYKNDLFGIINSLYNFEELKHRHKEFVNINYSFYKIDDTDKIIIQKYTENIKMNDETTIFIYNTLYKLLFYKKIQEIVLKKKILNPIKPFLLIPLEKILFMISNIDKPLDILKYMVEKRFD
jgi:hypothetical protein